jgi:hypothetical protein
MGAVSDHRGKAAPSVSANIGTARINPPCSTTYYASRPELG